MSNDFDRIIESWKNQKDGETANTTEKKRNDFDYDSYMKMYAEKAEKQVGREEAAKKAAAEHQRALQRQAMQQQAARQAAQQQQNYRVSAANIKPGQAQETQQRAAQNNNEQQIHYKNGVYFNAQQPRPAQQGARSAQQGARPAQSQPVAKKKNKKKSVAFRSMLPFMLAVLLLTSVISAIGISCINDVLSISKGDETPVAITIPADATTNDIIAILDEKGLISQGEFCKIFCQLTSKLKNTKAPEYLAGLYYVQSDMGVEEMLNMFKETQTASETEELIFPEGYSIYQIFDKLATFGVCKAEYLYASEEESDFQIDFLSELADSRACFPLEGYMFPDTYEFYINENPTSAIKRFLLNFESKWTEGYKKRAQELGMSMNDVVILASIIQKEAANKSQMAGISSVLHNRLNDPVNYPTLECDSTYEYVTKYLAPKIGDTAAQQYMKIYNTYICEGLPVGAICNPGMDAIEAALNPSDTSYYYFQHDKNGKIYYAESSAEHDKNALEVAKANSAD